MNRLITSFFSFFCSGTPLLLAGVTTVVAAVGTLEVGTVSFLRFNVVNLFTGKSDNSVVVAVVDEDTVVATMEFGGFSVSFAHF